MVTLQKRPETLLSQTSQFIPSRYQQDIFDAIERGENNIQVQAVAGSGKTTTLVQALNRLPLDIIRSTLVCAFNKEIANELGSRVPKGVTVKTIHAVGLSAVIAAMKQVNSAWSPDRIDGNKYRNMVRAWWEEKSPASMPEELFTPVIQLIHYARVTLTDFTDPEALSALLDEYEVECPDSYRAMICAEWVPQFLNWGAYGRPREENGRVVDPFRATWSPEEMIDYDDMLWLPHVHLWQPKRYKRVMVDECQDLSKAQLELVLKCLTDDGLLIAVGDPMQAIYGFTGADIRSYEQIAARTGALQLPLSVCYRCPRAVIELAQTLVPEIECGPDPSIGVVETIKAESFDALVQPGDMVLCRVNAPLIAAAFQLLAEGKRARVRGRDIGAQMIKLIDTIAKRKDFTFATFHESVEAWRKAEVASLDKRKNNEMRLQSIEDRADSICALYASAVTRGARTVPDLRAEVQALFVDDGAGYIILSSIHKAKGLEANRVFILKPNLMPHPMAKGAQIVQETNLKYVAITRAKRELYFVEDRPR
jgi:DNA helicase-2/ATP-dependent DNA helicase PcrA